LNQKQLRIFLIIIFLLFILILLVGCKTDELNTPENVIVQSDDEKFQISLPSSIDIEFNNDQNYSLDLFSSKDNMYLYANTIYKNREIDLLEYIKDDKEYIFSSKENSRNCSEISSVQIHDYKAYTYSFIYTDSDFGKDFYTQIIWIETSQNIYILNFEIIIENKDSFIQIFNDIAHSFTEI